MAVVYMPITLRARAGGEARLEVPGATLRALVRNLDERYPGVRESLVHPDDPDRLMPGLAAVVDGEPTNMGLLTPLAPDSEVHFLPAIAGGAPDSEGAFLPAIAGGAPDSDGALLPAIAGGA